MANLTITEAIKRSPVGKTQFYKKYIDTGAITVSVNNLGKKFIDSSELLRVFGEIKPEHSENAREQDAVNDSERSEKASIELVRSLQKQIDDLKADKQFYQTQISSLTNRLDAPRKRQSRLSKWWHGLDDKNY
jgi:chromosome segregation ATPase